MTSTVLSYPIPAYQNVPIQPENYKPRRFDIEDITLGETTLVTTTEDHNYVVGQICRLIIPPTCGCRDLNEKSGVVISIPADDQVVLTIFSKGITAFNASATNDQPQILAIGDYNSGAINNLGNMITSTLNPGSFSNISPQ